MESHVKVLGVLYIILGTLGTLAALVILFIFGGAAAFLGIAAHENPEAGIAIPIIGIVGSGLFLFKLIISVPGIIVGVGLLKFRPWARMVTIVLSALNLINFPIGTLLGIYGLWVMLSRGTEQLFNPPQGPPTRI
jgi:hypothetical protein